MNRSASGRSPVLVAEDLSVSFAGKVALQGVSLAIPRGCLTALIGPEGGGKSTLLRSFNRLNELTPGAVTAGRVLLNGVDVHRGGVDAATVRRKVGMVFPEATLFPRSIFDNVAFGLRASGQVEELHNRIEEALTTVGLWSGIADTPDSLALSLAPGDRQRLCFARTLALRPEVLLLDEPTTALDSAATARIESLIHGLKGDYTIVLATSGRRQAARLSELTAYLEGGEVVEHGPTEAIFTNPRDARTESYLTGRFR